MAKLCYLLLYFSALFASAANAQDSTANPLTSFTNELSSKAKKTAKQIAASSGIQTGISSLNKKGKTKNPGTAAGKSDHFSHDPLLYSDTAKRPFNRVEDISPRFYRSNDTLWIYSGICKTLKTRMLTGITAISPGIPKETPNPFIKVHGNIQYDYLFRSFSDTPYHQKDFRQHTIQTSLLVTIKDNYPFRVNFVVRKSNSPYFKDFFDGGVLFDRLSYYKNIKEQLMARIMKQLPEQPYLDAARSLLNQQLEKYNILKRKLNDPDLAQRLIEERERKYFQSLQRSATTIPAIQKPGIDSLVDDLEEIVAAKKRELDSLKVGIDRLKGKIDSITNRIQANIATVRRKLNKSVSPVQLAKTMKEYGLDEKKEKWEKIIGNLRTVGIGRSVLNYSELTARNISLTGINIEYNPGMYAAVAAGKIDYGFRDFFGKNTRSSDQYLLMGRIGLGDIEKRAVIFSIFNGRKTNYGAILSDTVSGNIQVTGYSLETIIKKDEKTFFSAEIAKSTRPVTGRYDDTKELGSLFRFSDLGNLGISVKGQTILSETETRLSALFRKTGENFQSFSLFSYNTDQTAWMMKMEQPFLENKASFTGMIRKNDFVNPFTEKTFKTSTVFGSAQLSLRVPKWPSLSAGYYPGSQFYIIDNNRVRENVYYILNGTIVHQYKLAGIRMLSSVIYNNYTTRGTDSGFINYTGTNYMLSQSIHLRKFECQGNFIYTDQQEIKFFTAEGNLAFIPSDKFRLGGGIKYNKIISGQIYWGSTGQLMIDMKGLGNLQLQYEKSFLPTIQQTLFPVESGRLTWFKTF